MTFSPALRAFRSRKSRSFSALLSSQIKSLQEARSTLPLQPVLRHCGEAVSAALFLKGQAVCALLLGGVTFVSAHLDTVERAVVIAYAVVFAVLYCTADVLVCKFSSHNMKLPFIIIIKIKAVTALCHDRRSCIICKRIVFIQTNFSTSQSFSAT